MFPECVICLSACSVGTGTFHDEGGTYVTDLSRCNGKGGFLSLGSCRRRVAKASVGFK